ncbi:MAG: hypothetical protein QGF28_05800 [Candidatus Thalassarchaeaceae archaeon]|jgi:hypothetical protein|nr:hypothetical protein [Euryarchaeota archaeon]MDP6221099.1 hypothetical protein [Candidatus Thalassarchaeaceae archaeon]MDP7091777.1 hypothetical protein [Candidatus Thalassarchaeaceae archaeon]MDP7257340.1 hypothetical protein [Candidatus Thalassarchaeaceae archaeon]MDP7446694.1 hypothetical protein [Candidatus Thalassarchaeaceae archaeon]|tara:strand:+ start:2464 stop:2721 length:258 start_codon:yes stop_codon:yes gene_type:complete
MGQDFSVWVARFVEQVKNAHPIWWVPSAIVTVVAMATLMGFSLLAGPVILIALIFVGQALFVIFNVLVLGKSSEEIDMWDGKRGN